MLLHIEIIIKKEAYAPENVLIQVYTSEGKIEENADCYADIISSQVNTKKKPLKKLENIYDFISLRTFIVSQDKGFYLLETGFADYQEDFEIRIVCYSEGLKGVSYTIINNTNTNCEIKDNGKFLVC